MASDPSIEPSSKQPAEPPRDAVFDATSEQPGEPPPGAAREPRAEPSPEASGAPAPDPSREPAPDSQLEDRPQPGGASAQPASAADGRDLIVAMHGVSHRFDHHEVLSGIELTVPRGTILGIIGPSGAGKTTTIRLLTGAISPTRGEVSVMGRSPQRFRRSDRERIGYMPQAFTLYEDLTAGENIDFVASLFGMLWHRRRKRVQEVLKLVGLWDVRGRQAGQLSGGMQRRLELACALVHQPELIILDEPTAGIDPLLRGTIWDELHRLRDAGRTLLVTTQHISEADECDTVALIVGGRIIALAPPDELRRLATDGDLLDIETSAVFDGAELNGMRGIRAITQDGPRHLRIVVADAGSSLPEIVEKIRTTGAEVTSAREQRLSFDDIFAILVNRHEEERRAERAGAASDDQGRGGQPCDGSPEAAA